MTKNVPKHNILRCCKKTFLIFARIVVLLPAYYLAYVTGYFLVILMVEPTAILTFDDYQQAFNTMPKMALLLSLFCLGIPFVAEFSGLLYAYTGKKAHFMLSVLFVTWKTFLLLLVAIVGGKYV